MTYTRKRSSRRTVLIQPSTEVAWTRFAGELSAALPGLEEDEYLIVQVKYTNRFVQFAAQGAVGMRAESTSDFYLPREQQLSEDQYALLLDLGWNAPTNLPDQLEAGGLKPDGSPNYFLDLAQPVPYDVLAQLASATLEQVHGARHPGRLEYVAAGTGKVSFRFPNLGIRRAK